jgi:hypothetical protein
MCGTNNCSPRYSGVEVGGSQFKASPGKVNVKPYLKNKLKSIDLAAGGAGGHGSSGRALA